MRIAALSAVLGIGSCASGAPHDVPLPSAAAPPLSVSLARFRTTSESGGDSLATTVRTDSVGRIPGDRTAGDAAPATARPRALDPVPPLYIPPSRAPALQPLLDAPSATLPGPRPRSSRSWRRDPLGSTDPLRRIDPVSGRDPLGRLDPSGGVDLDGTLAR